MQNPSITFTLPLAASNEEVELVIRSIARTFGRHDSSIGSNGAEPVTTIAPDAGISVEEAVEAANANAPATDINGLPWDERIHAGTKALNADGSWRNKRGVDPKLLAKVTKELQATMSAPAALPVAAAAPALALPLPAAALPNPAYANFVKFIVSQTHSAENPTGRLTDEWVKATLTNYGVADGSMQNLAHRPDLIADIEAGIRAALGL